MNPALELNPGDPDAGEPLNLARIYYSLGVDLKEFSQVPGVMGCECLNPDIATIVGYSGRLHGLLHDFGERHGLLGLHEQCSSLWGEELSESEQSTLKADIRPFKRQEPEGLVR